MICGKVIYPTRQVAVDAIKGMMADNQDRNGTFRSNKLPSRSYFCAECKGWHLHTENKKQAVRKLKAQRTKQEVHADEKPHNHDKRLLIIHDPKKFKIK